MARKTKAEKDKFLLFELDKLTKSSSRLTHIDAYKNCGFEYKTPHDYRHTRGLLLISNSVIGPLQALDGTCQ